METPLKNFKKYNTITTPTFNQRKGIVSHFRNTQRKSISVLNNTNPEDAMNATHSRLLENLSLPKIQGKRKTKKQGTFLESWLDQALGVPDPFATENIKKDTDVDSNVLKTVRKFQLDKRHLKSQNIAPETIQKLYKSLYIYSHGVNKVFEQLNNFIQVTDNVDLLGNFWRAYTKLLEGCTSYQTVFHKVEKGHLENMQRIRHTLQIRTQQFNEQKKQLVEKIKRLIKQSEDKDIKFSQLKNQYQILQTTLNLTDEAFNQQVNLRLKFQQKINAIYTTYDELKGKYFKLVEQMSIKNTDFLQKQNKQSILKNELLIQRTRVQQLKFLLKAQKDKVAQRDSQIVIKNQQLEDMRCTILSKASSQDNTQQQMEEHLSKFKALKMKMIEVENIVAGQKCTIKQQQAQINKLTNINDEIKKQNTQIYKKYVMVGKNIVQAQSNIEQKQFQIIDLRNKVSLKSSQLNQLSQELTQTKSLKQNFFNELTTSKKSLQNCQQTLAKNNILINQMRSVKDRHERINQILKIEIKQIQELYNRTLKESLQIKQQSQGLKLVVENRDKQLQSIQKQLIQFKQLFKNKQISYTSEIRKKQSMALQYQKRKQEVQKQMTECKISLSKALDKILITQSNQLKAEAQLKVKSNVLNELESLISDQNQKYKELNNKFEGEMKQKQDLNSKLQSTQFVLNLKNNEQKIQITNLVKLLNEYKSKMVQRAQFIHPMIHQQVLQELRKSYQQINILKKQTQLLKFQELNFKMKNKQSEKVIEQMKKTIQQLKDNNFQNISEQNNLLQKAKQQQLKAKSIKQFLQKQQNLNKNLKERLQLNKKSEQKLLQEQMSIQTQKNNLKQKISELEKLLSTSASKNVESVSQIKFEQKQIQTVYSLKSVESQTVNQYIETYCQTEKQNNILESARQKIETEELVALEPKQKDIQSFPQKKVENKDFKKALKLTYMRR